MEVLSCPGCGSSAFRCAAGFGSAFETVLGIRSFEQPNYQIRICQQCELYYKSHVLSLSELNEYYALVDFSKWNIGKLFPSESAILDVLSRLPAKARVLDYGCSDGRLLSNLGGEYLKFGSEVNGRAAKRSSEKGITLVSNEEINNGAHLIFDAIVLSDTFEHLPNPLDVLATLRKHLSCSGFLILFSGNADAKACQRDPSNFWYFRTVEHLCMLTRTHANYIAHELNLRLLSWTEMCHYELPLRQRVRQRVQDFAYWKFRTSARSIWPLLLRLVPVLKKAERWDLPPAITCTNDHVLAVFQNQQ